MGRPTGKAPDLFRERAGGREADAVGLLLRVCGVASVKPQVLVHLKCGGCEGVFFAPRVWVFARLEAGKPPMRCRACDPECWRTDLADRPKPNRRVEG